jgi:hypothetical protein
MTMMTRSGRRDAGQGGDVLVASVFRGLDDRVDIEAPSAALAALGLPGPLVDGYLRGMPGASPLQ